MMRIYSSKLIMGPRVGKPLTNLTYPLTCLFLKQPVTCPKKLDQVLSFSGGQVKTEILAELCSARISGNRLYGLGCGWLITQSTMGPHRIVFPPPALYQNLGLLQGGENLPVEQLDRPHAGKKLPVATIQPNRRDGRRQCRYRPRRWAPLPPKWLIRQGDHGAARRTGMESQSHKGTYCFRPFIRAAVSRVSKDIAWPHLWV